LKRIGLVLLILLSAEAGLATEFYSWHVLDDALIATKRLEVILHSRMRTRQEFHSLQQVRFGPIVRASLHPRVIGFAGYYYQPAHEPGGPWDSGHRAFVGIELPFRKGTTSVTQRVAFERHIGTGRPNYNRYRTYTRLTWEKRVAPYFPTRMAGGAAGLSFGAQQRRSALADLSESQSRGRISLRHSPDLLGW
jgi:hypothetical protein